jgi:hypothetical protein
LLLHETSAARSRPHARGALTAVADILLDVQLAPGKRFSRPRRFSGVGCYPGTLQRVAAELNPEGADYLLLAEDLPEAALTPAIETLRQLLGQSPEPVTSYQILARWPDGKRPPRADSLWRSLTRGCERGILVRTGAGTKVEALRYTVAEGQTGA